MATDDQIKQKLRKIREWREYLVSAEIEEDQYYIGYFSGRIELLSEQIAELQMAKDGQV